MLVGVMRNARRFWIVNGLVLAAFAALSLRAVEEPKNDFRFALIGDRTGGAQPQIYGRVWREVDLLHPDFVLNVGDSIQGGDDATAAKEWSELRPVWARYNHYPHYFTAGNHDVWSDVSRQIYERETGRPTHYSFKFEDAFFVVLDTATRRDDPLRGTLNDGQMAYLERELEANKDAQPKFVIFHHPFWIGEIDNTAGDFPLHRLATKYGVNAVISGHGHRFVRRVHEGVTYMEVGSSGGQMTGGLTRGEGFRDGLFYHWMWARVKGGKVSFTVKEIGGGMGDGRMFRAEEWDRNGPKFDVGDPALSDGPET